MTTETISTRNATIAPARSGPYSRSGYELGHAQRLTRTGKNYYDSLKLVLAGTRMSLASEELALQLALERADADPRQAGVFDDLFARNEDRIYIWQWTATGLRVPKGRKADVYETDEHGNKRWVREVIEYDKKVGEVMIPEGSGRLVAEWDEVFGIPRVTIENRDLPHEPYTTHFWFNANPSQDSTSGYQDVAVGRGGGWRHVEHPQCLGLGAGCGRWGAYSDNGFRSVRGSAPHVIKETTNDTEAALLERMRADFRTIPFPEFIEKYRL